MRGGELGRRADDGIVKVADRAVLVQVFILGEVGSLDDGTVDDEAYSAITVSAETSLTDSLDVGVAYTSINDGDIDGYVTEDDVLVVSISGDLF